jgi:hypothetical protein
MADGFIVRKGGASALEITGQEIITGEYAEAISKFDTVALTSIENPDVKNKLPDPASLPTNNGEKVSFSSDNTYLAVAHGTSPFITIYKRSGDTFTKLANPAILPGNFGLGVSFSPDTIYLAVSHGNNPYITIYKRSGDIFTKLTNPAALPNDSTRNPD